MDYIGKHKIDRLPAIIADHLINPTFGVEMSLYNIRKAIELGKSNECIFQLLDMGEKSMEELKISLQDFVQERITFE